jgi:hypothetical protein
MRNFYLLIEQLDSNSNVIYCGRSKGYHFWVLLFTIGIIAMVFNSIVNCIGWFK